MIGNEEDFTACLGFKIEGNDENLTELNLDGYKKMINEAVKTYPNFKAVATTLHEVKTATVNDWSAVCWADGEIYKTKDYKGQQKGSRSRYGRSRSQSTEITGDFISFYGPLGFKSFEGP